MGRKHCRVEETSPGIYAVGGYPVVIQVIASKKLPFEENLWLKGLSNNLNAAAAGTILEEAGLTAKWEKPGEARGKKPVGKRP
ncbi:MAG: hypothetical protein LBF78_05240 [Treponema sp.]|nr:hypothetical protein [Treponema sp.]